MFYTLLHKDTKTKARAGVVQTAHGAVETPVFMPVGTRATVKAINQDVLSDEIKAQIILGNTYHLYLRPGTEILEKAGGLHKFMSWKKPLLTDSGGFQVFSLSSLMKIKRTGIEFKSHIDGSKHVFTPAKVIGIERSIGSDIMMPLDECTPYPCTYEYARKAVQLTSVWAAENKEAFQKTTPLYGHQQYLFGIVQGSVYKDLREQSARDLTGIGFDGYSIGGLAVGEPAEVMYEMVDFVTDFLPEHQPRYLMGVGRPENMLEAIARGCDMFDCVMPTRNARNSYIFTSKGILSMRNNRYKDDFSPMDEDCGCYTCRNYSRAYLRHLFIAKELLVFELASIHNLYFYVHLLQEARKHILDGTFAEWKEETVKMVTRHL